MLKREDASNDLRGAVVAAHQSKGGLESRFQLVWSLSFYISGKHWIQLPVFPGVQVLARFPWDQTVQCLNWKKPRSASHTLHASACLSLWCTIYKKKETGMTCLQVSGKSALSWQHSLGLQSCMWIFHKSCRTMFVWHCINNVWCNLSKWQKHLNALYIIW